MLGEWYLPPGKCQAISTITEGIISISHPAPLSSQTRIPQTSSPLVDKSQATQAALLQIRRSEVAVLLVRVNFPPFILATRAALAQVSGECLAVDRQRSLPLRERGEALEHTDK